MKEIITAPLSAITLESAIKPATAEMEKGMSASHRTTTPSIKARGTPLETIQTSRAEPNSV